MQILRQQQMVIMNHSPNKSEKPKTRLEALSDGTFAIVFTILVPELIIRDKHFEEASAFMESAEEMTKLSAIKLLLKNF